MGLPGIAVGDRVDVNGHRGSVKYIGPVDGYSGEWVGIDWDDETRGKHNGTIKGKFYFRSRGDKSASFVRASNVTCGKDITEEMRLRYAERIEMDHQEVDVKTVQFVAMEKIYRKQRDIWKLRCVVLDNMHVAKPPSADCRPFIACTELNLHNNLISKWSVLVDILKFFPSLLYLNLRRNVMEPGMSSITNDNCVIEAPVFHIVLSECRLDYEAAKRLLKLFPRTRELYLARNGLQRFDPGANDNNLTLLDLEGNPIGDFKNLHNLSTLPKLESLNLTNCGLTKIILPEPVGFPVLRTLNLYENTFAEWRSVSELAKLPSLRQLFLKGQELRAEFGLDQREIIIAKIPKLADLGRCDVSAIERRSCEIRFLNKYGTPPVKEEHREDIERLKKIYGEPDVVNPSSNVGIHLLKLKFAYGDEEIERSVPARMSIQNTCGMACRLFKLNPRNVSLQAEIGDSEKRQIIKLDIPSRSIDFFSVSDGDTIRVVNS